jgi:hypothetical protein
MAQKDQNKNSQRMKKKNKERNHYETLLQYTVISLLC